MELFRVTIEYVNRLAEPEPDLCGQTPPHPACAFPRKTVSAYAAVHGGFGSSMASRAADVALSRVIGERYDEDLWQPIVMAIEFVGVVHVDDETGGEETA